MVNMHQPLSCLPKRMYMATTQISGCVETTVLSIGKLSPISMPCLHLRRSLMLWDMRGSSVHLIFGMVSSVADLKGGQGQDCILGRQFSRQDYLYQWKILFFGLKNMPTEFQCVMDRILAGLDLA